MDPILGGALISAGGNLLSSLFGSDPEPPQLNLKDLVSRSQAAGFNPLTVLQATGGQGFQQQASSNDFDVFGQALGQGLQAYGDYFANSQQRELANAQIDLAKAQTLSLMAEQGSNQGPSVQDLSAYEEYLKTGKIPDQEPRNFPIRTQTGQVLFIYPSQAKRMRINAGDTVEEGALSEIFGEINELEAFVRYVMTPFRKVTPEGVNPTNPKPNPRSGRSTPEVRFFSE